jgi:hypothetical protein
MLKWCHGGGCAGILVDGGTSCTCRGQLQVFFAMGQDWALLPFLCHCFLVCLQLSLFAALACLFLPSVPNSILGFWYTLARGVY